MTMLFSIFLFCIFAKIIWDLAVQYLPEFADDTAIAWFLIAIISLLMTWLIPIIVSILCVVYALYILFLIGKKEVDKQ